MKDCNIIGRQMNVLLRHMTIGLSCRIKFQFSTDVNSCTLEMICFVPSTKHSEIPKEREGSKVWILQWTSSGLIQVYFTAVLSFV
jgi:hypothetical protein